MGKKYGPEKACATCGTMFKGYEATQVYCSRACHHKGMTGRERATVTAYTRPDGYRLVRVGLRSWRLEHRLVAERMLGRGLLPTEHVHHSNGDRADNRPENLVVLTNAEHQKLHDWPTVRSKRVTLACKRCGTAYERRPSRVAESNYCSAACRLGAQHEAARAYWARRRKED